MTINFISFSNELQKIAQDKITKERAREAARHAVAAGAGTAAGIAGADLLAHYVTKRHPNLVPIIRSKAMRYGIPGMLAAGSVYASHKYKKNIDEAIRRAGE